MGEHGVDANALAARAFKDFSRRGLEARTLYVQTLREGCHVRYDRINFRADAGEEVSGLCQQWERASAELGRLVLERLHGLANREIDAKQNQGLKQNSRPGHGDKDNQDGLVRHGDTFMQGECQAVNLIRAETAKGAPRVGSNRFKHPPCICPNPQECKAPGLAPGAEDYSAGSVAAVLYASRPASTAAATRVL
jgi:hypothetical protein